MASALVSMHSHSPRQPVPLYHMACLEGKQHASQALWAGVSPEQWFAPCDICCGGWGWEGIAQPVPLHVGRDKFSSCSSLGQRGEGPGPGCPGQKIITHQLRAGWVDRMRMPLEACIRCKWCPRPVRSRWLRAGGPRLGY